MLSKEQLTHKLKVKSKVQETDNAFSFVLDIPDSLQSAFQYKAGQFVTLFVNPNGQEVRRSYSLSSSPDWDNDFKFTVKRVPGGLVSNWLIDDINQGDTLDITPPAGLFNLPADNSKNFVFFAGGSGITPVISLIKSALKSIEGSVVNLLYCSRDKDLIIFNDELADIKNKYPDNFNYLNSLSSDIGRLQSSDIEDFWNNNKCSKDAQHYLCGPEGLMVTVQAALEHIGINRNLIHRESFAKTTVHSDYIDSVGHDAVFIGDKASSDTPVQIEAEVDGQWVQVEAKEGVSVLETLLEAGHNPPYSCMDGACMACLGKVQEGLVYQEDMGILTSDNTEVGECLTCQAMPASKNLKVSYEI